MRCHKAREQISRSMDEALSEFDRSQLVTHVDSCSPCSRYREDLEKASRLIARSQTEPSDNFEWKVQLKIQRALREAAAAQADVAERRGSWVPVGATALVMAAVVVLLGGYLIVSRTAIDPPSGQVPDSTPVAGLVPHTPAPLGGDDGFGLRRVGSNDVFRGFYEPAPMELRLQQENRQLREEVAALRSQVRSLGKDLELNRALSDDTALPVTPVTDPRR